MLECLEGEISCLQLPIKFFTITKDMYFGREQEAVREREEGREGDKGREEGVRRGGGGSRQGAEK